ncbi:MAG: MarR family transcriptional regulator [Chromatiales bacterium]|nr:MAG: MarR family transcriptional regulator [Chromatiales bacterium]
MMHQAANDGARELAELLLQLGRAAYAEGAGGDLSAAQWAALRYFARANRFSRTVSGFAEFHATTRGTASQTVKSLVNRGFLERARSERDGRSVLFKLTQSARRHLRQDPFDALVRAAGRLNKRQLNDVTGELRRVGQYLEVERDTATVGRCERCGHLLDDRGEYRCGLMEEPLAEVELREICVRYRARS